MDRNLLGAIFFILIVVTLGLNPRTSSIKASSTIIYVDDSNITGPWNGTTEYPYQNITSALEHALDGDAIIVHNGTYYENLAITKSVSLQGQNRYGTIVDGSKKEDVIKVTTNNVTIAEFTIQNGGLTSSLSGIYIVSSSGSRIYDNIIKNNYNGLQIYASTECKFSNNHFLNNTIGLWMSGCSNNTVTENEFSSNTNIGVYASNSYNITFSNNTLLNNEFGISFVASDNNFVTDNNITPNNRYGVYAFSSTNNIFSRNNISLNNDFGIWFSQSNNNTLTNNNIFSNERIGIYLVNSIANVMRRNKISENNQHGIRLDYSNYNMITHNTFSNNLIRGTLLYYSNNNTVFYNNFMNNTEAASNINSTNHFDNGAEGNYWSDYYGIDDNQDGIGDTLYIVDSNNTDNHPLMGTISSFSIIHQESTFQIPIISNSRIFQLQFNETLGILDFKAEGINNTKGFCRITIPEQLIHKPHIILIDSKETNSTSLSISNSTHTYIYFAYNHSIREVQIFSKPYYELLQKYNTLLEDLTRINSTLYELTAEYRLLNATFYQTLANYTQLMASYDTLNGAYQEVLTNYMQLQNDYNSLSNNYNLLNQTHQLTMTNYAQLLDNYNTLNQTYQGILASYNFLLEQYNSLSSTYGRVETELASIRIALWLVAIVAITATTIISSITIKFYQKSEEQKRIAEKYMNELKRINFLDVARTQFEEDTQRRKEKIEKFENKYGIAIRPHNKLEEIIANLNLKKKKEDQH